MPTAGWWNSAISGKCFNNLLVRGLFFGAKGEERQDINLNVKTSRKKKGPSPIGRV